MAEYLAPGVYVEEFDSGPMPMQGVGTSTAGFIGVAEKGTSVGTPKLVISFADFTRKFGGYLQKNEFGDYRYLAYAVNNFFVNGGTKAYVIRVLPSDATVSKGVCLEGKEEIIDIKSKNPGKWGNNINIYFEATSDTKTPILKNLENGKYKLKSSIGFTVGDVVVLDNAGNLQYNMVTLISKDNVVDFEKPFEGEVVDANLVPKIFLKTCELNIEVAYGENVEKFENVSFNTDSPNFLEKKLSRSEFIDINVKIEKSVTAPIEVVRQIFGGEGNKICISLKGGNNGSSANLTDGDFIGKDEGPGARTGIQAFLDNSDVNLMIIPGVTSPNVQLSLIQHCENLGSRFAILDMPLKNKIISDILAHKEMIDSDYCALYHPWIRTYDPLDKADMFMPPSGSVAGIYARCDSARGVHKAPANEIVSNCTGLSVGYNSTEQGLLNPKGVNLIRKFPGAGIRVWGARTASSKPLWKYINVRRLFIFLEESIKANTNWVVFEPNDAALWARVGRTIELFLEGIWKTGALVGGSPGEGFFVDIGPNTMTKDDIDNGRLICVIGVAPVKPAEFVIFRITQKTGE
ncbi:MAG: phage tail sheath subtilisin-like domain-containing protein [Candidatus Paraimprobicoccus trichonymphae]|uniref:Phage tail sheath subtilisin-like domain-containing protein n=1 Tax=Candidatus Paraimprobicoccus trichonymphae TaxID=3033793 RepID=A0AA48I932_9FIRM|nr:MAG: phage tail sheath subtilisin-like domain-containing protein [Candidatus Paraimprobicoccus trichonymphae]